MADDTSTYVPERVNSTLHLDRNNETVVSGMTECSFEEPSAASLNSRDNLPTHASTSLPPSRFRGGTASRLYGSGASMGSRGSRGSRRSRHSRGNSRMGGGSVRSGISNFGPIAEGDEEAHMMDNTSDHGTGSVGVGPNRRTSGDDNSIWMGSETSSVYQNMAFGGGGGRYFEAAGMFGRSDGGSVASEQRGGGGSVGQSSPPHGGSVNESGADDNSIWMGSEDRSVPGYNTTPDFSAPPVTFSNSNSNNHESLSFSDTSSFLHGAAFGGGGGREFDAARAGGGQPSPSRAGASVNEASSANSSFLHGLAFGGGGGREFDAARGGGHQRAGVSSVTSEQRGDGSDGIGQSSPSSRSNNGSLTFSDASSFLQGAAFGGGGGREFDAARAGGGQASPSRAGNNESNEPASIWMGSEDRSVPGFNATPDFSAPQVTAFNNNDSNNGAPVPSISRLHTSTMSGLSFSNRSATSNTGSQWLNQDQPQRFTSGVANSSNSLAGGRGQFQHNAQAGNSGGSVVSLNNDHDTNGLSSGNMYATIPEDASVVSGISTTSRWMRQDRPQTSGVANSSNSLAGGRGQFQHNAQAASSDGSVISGQSFGQRSMVSNTSEWMRQDQPQQFTSGVANSSNSLAGGCGQFQHNAQAARSDGSVISGQSFGQRSMASNTSEWTRQDQPQHFTSGVANSKISLAGGCGQFQHNAQSGASGASSVVSSSVASVGTQRDRPSAPFSSSTRSIQSGSQQQSIISNSLPGSPVSQQRQRQSGVFNRENSSGIDALQEEDNNISNGELAITKDEQANILLAAYGNTRLPSHNPKTNATQEINVAFYQEQILDADEITALPEEYVLDDFGQRYHPSKKDWEKDLLEIEKKKRKSRDEFEMLPTSFGGDEPWKSPFAKKQRLRTSITILTAVALAVLGLVTSIRSLSPTPEQYASYEAKQMGATNNNNGRNLYLPGYQFGGGVGGLVAGQELERMKQLAYGSPYNAPPPKSSDEAGRGYSPAVGSHSVNGGSYSGGRTSLQGRGISGIASYHTSSIGVKEEDPYSGAGPPQFNPEYTGNNQQLLPRLTSTPLTSYTPPPNNEDGTTTIVLDPDFNGAFMDLAMLPFNPSYEMPVVLDIPLSGGSATKHIFGNCLKLVQCSERGADVLESEYGLWKEDQGGLHDVSNRVSRHSSSRNLMTLIAKGRKDFRNLGEEEEVDVVQEPIAVEDTTQEQKSAEESTTKTPFDPPLRSEVVFTSTYINVDCSTPQGIDRGIATNLVTSSMADVLHSPNIHDVARLFAPPVKAYGRGVVVLRNPIERAVAKYHWMRTINKDVREMSLEEFAKSDHLEDNIVTRSLASKVNAEIVDLGTRELTVAKEILKRKFIVGLFHHMEESIGRFETFFGWHIGNDGHACQHTEIGLTMSKHYNDNRNVILPPYNTGAYESLFEKNRLDVALYEFAMFLYDYQGHVLFGINVESVE